MYKFYRLVTITVNTKGGEAETTEKMSKEVDGEIVPCTRDEALLKLHNKISSVGGNPNTQSIKCTLLDLDGNPTKDDSVVKPIEPTVDAKQIAIDKAVADYKANPTDENLAKIKEVVTAE